MRAPEALFQAQTASTHPLAEPGVRSQDDLRGPTSDTPKNQKATCMPPSQHTRERLAEAARYALLRRLAPALRHNMAGSLQPIAMMAALLEKRLQKPDPDMPTLAKNSAALGGLSRDAALSCMNLMAWLAPKNNDPVVLETSIEEAISLLTTELSFRGFSLVNETAGVQAELPCSVVRNVFMATLVALTDTGMAPATVLVTAKSTDGELTITISLVATEGESMPGAIAAYRELEWADVEVLAEADSVGLTRDTGRAELRLQLA